MLGFFIPLVIFLGISYIMIVLPNKKIAKNKQILKEELKIGDKIILGSGIIGRVAKISDDRNYVVINSEGSTIKVVTDVIQEILTNES